MIDQDQRTRLALLLRRLASGQLPAPDFEDLYYDLQSAHPTDSAVREIAYFGWTLFGDWDDRLTGRRAIDRDARRTIARCVLFLRTAREYPWPAHPPAFTWRDLVSVVTFGLVTWRHPDWKLWLQAVDHTVWPFAKVGDLAETTRSWPFDSGSGPQAV